MKLKALYISINIILIALIVVSYYKVDSYYLNSKSVVECNDARMQAVSRIQMGDSVPEIERDLNCEIILTSQHEYQNQLYHAMEDGKLIFDYIEDGQLIAKVCFNSNQDMLERVKGEVIQSMIIVFVICLILFNIMAIYIYTKIIRPFSKLRKFAKNIALGDLDIPLLINKDNYFGAFTESFDLMREELKAAKEGEYQANRSKRELVASLSHDIKTPVATINALCEILEIKLKEEENKKKIVTIHEKANMIDQLISNLFHATLEDLQALKIQTVEEESTIIPKMFEDLNHYELIRFQNSIPECIIYADALRLNQTIDNIINNSYKYANTQINVTFGEVNDYITIQIRDYGAGIEDSELAVVTQKFYRGSNSNGKNGSGLGLYLAKQFLEGMKGSLEVESNGGFIVTISLKKV